MTEQIGTQPPELLDAMLAMIRRKGRTDAKRVTGYRERSYNIGYCETCSEIVADVRIYYRRTDGTETHYQVQYTNLGQLIRELTDDQGEQGVWDAAATYESSEEAWNRLDVHHFDEEAGGFE